MPSVPLDLTACNGIRTLYVRTNEPSRKVRFYHSAGLVGTRGDSSHGSLWADWWEAPADQTTKRDPKVGVRDHLGVT